VFVGSFRGKGFGPGGAGPPRAAAAGAPAGAAPADALRQAAAPVDAARPAAGRSRKRRARLAPAVIDLDSSLEEEDQEADDEADGSGEARSDGVEDAAVDGDDAEGDACARPMAPFACLACSCHHIPTGPIALVSACQTLSNAVVATAKFARVRVCTAVYMDCWCILK